MYVENNIKTVTDDKEYYLNLPHLVVGSLETFNTIKPVYSNGIMELKEIEYNQCLVKQIEEAIQNACDEFVRTKGDYANKISVKVDVETGYITVSDNGRGIPLDTYVASATNFKTGSNFTWLNEEGNQERENIGAHGIGSKLITLFSTDYEMITTTEKGKGVLVCKDNMSSINHKETIGTYKTLGTVIKWLPDYGRMKLTKISNDLLGHINMLIVNMAISFQNIQFTFNGRMVKVNTFKDYMNHISPNSTILVDSEDICLAVYPTDEPKHVHIVNSIDINKGGVALSYISNNIVNAFADRLKKGYAKITNTSVKNRLGIALILRNMKNLKFGAGQTKEELKNTVTELKLPTFDYKQFAETIFKNSHIRMPIIELYKVQQELDNRTTLKSMKTATTKRVDKFFPATKEKKYCYLAEGESAKGLLMNLSIGITRTNCSFYSLLGKPLNVMNASSSQVANNKVLKDLVLIFGVALGGDINGFSHENVVIASDSDADGMGPITGGLIMFFAKYYPDLIKQGRLKKLYLPLMIAYKNDDIVAYFRDFSAYQAWAIDNNPSDYKLEYYKGLGGFNNSTIETLFNTYGFESFIDTIEWDDNTNKTLENWLHKDMVQFRKEALTADNVHFNIGIM